MRWLYTAGMATTQTNTKARVSVALTAWESLAIYQAVGNGPVPWQALHIASTVMVQVEDAALKQYEGICDMDEECWAFAVECLKARTWQGNVREALALRIKLGKSFAEAAEKASQRDAVPLSA